MRRIILGLALALACTAPVAAGFFAKFMASSSGATPAAAQILLSLGQADLGGTLGSQPTCINWLKCTQYNLNGNSPTILDANLYPNNGAVTNTMSWATILLPASSYYSGNWEIIWTGGPFQINVDNGITIVSDPQSCSNGDSSGNVSHLKGTNCDVTYSYGANPSGNAQIPPGTWGTGTPVSGVALIRTSDKAAYLAGQIFTPEFLNILSALNPLVLRAMGMGFNVQQTENESSWGARLPSTAASFQMGNGYWIPNDWAGSDTTHTDNYILTSYPNMPGSWTNSELFQASFTNGSNPALTITGAANDSGNSEVRLTVSSTSALSTNQQVLVSNCAESLPPTVYTITVENGTTLDLQGTTYSSIWNDCPQSGGGNGLLTTTTVNVGSRGAKFVLPMNSILSSPGIANGDTGTFVYDALLGVLLYSNGGIYGGLPPEMMVALANEAGKPLWFNIPPLWQTADVTSAIDYFNSNLNGDLYLEFNNENWNFATMGAQLFTQRGLGIGLITSSNEAMYSYIGLEIRQLFGAATSAWTKGSSHLHRVNAAQACCDTASDFSTYQLSGSVLCGTSCGNSTYQSKVGTDYDVSPNRPMDYSDAYSVATYFQGAQAQGGAPTLASINGTCNGTVCTGLIASASCYASPSSTTCGTGGTAQLGLNFIDTDTRSGTYIGYSGCLWNVAGANSFTIGCMNNSSTGYAYQWNAQAAADGKQLIAYEGAWSGYGPTAAQLTALGDGNASTDATNINNLLIAYRSSSLFYTTYIFWNTTWFANSQAVGNSQLGIQGSGSSIPVGVQNWQLVTGIMPLATYQNYNAFEAINYLLNRDLDPANDNAPAFLYQAA